MALVNYTLPFGSLQAPSWATVSPIHNQHASAVNNLLYGPGGHQEDDPNDQGFYENIPYSPPQQQQHSASQQSSQYRQAPRNNYLPPSQQSYTQPPPKQQVYQQPQSSQPSRTYGEGSYSQIAPSRGSPQYQNPSYYNTGGYNQHPKQQPSSFNVANQQPPNTYRGPGGPPPSPPLPPKVPQAQGTPPPNRIPPPPVSSGRGISSTSVGGAFPERPPGFVKVNAGQGSRTQVHAVLDYDDDEEEYYDDADDGSPNVAGRVPDSRKNSRMPTVTPIQGPIFLKNGTVPVVPLFAYPQVSNGTFVQIPIWWTALSLALGLNVRGDVIKGVPCVKKNHQLFCPTAGNSYPIDKIETFIDENKALMKRMYGDFEMTSRNPPPLQPSRKRKRHLQETDDHFTILPELMDLYGVPGSPDAPEMFVNGAGDSYFGKLRNKRQSQNRANGAGGNGGGSSSGSSNGSGSNSNRSNGRQGSTDSSGESTGRVDACESKIEIVTPYWASNSAGKVRAIVNTQHFEQAIHQEVCSKTQTSRCSGDCGCEQKYKWHRLLAYDPDNDCKGIFMDWFLFPSCCVCRCNP
ncbi:protein spaetzle 3 [Malaya genurostris]|uniref:protein spaetzle 3 n=1 Tax=Malaya genurostris TaxID=325434 RepID=UPI0026F39A28|nr:protein spaetzle 3 [Malaya genurostris]XP_058450664.1 protein spaetzle 3 [Malaya genurostris]